jgi:hypothetical protein
MTGHSEEGTQLEQLRGLEEIDVTNWAEDDEALKQIFEEKVNNDSSLYQNGADEVLDVLHR